MKEILSTKNELIKKVVKLHKRKYRYQERQYIIEGFHLIEEAVLHQSQIDYLFVTSKALAQYGDWFNEQTIEVIVVSEEVLQKLSDLPTPQGMLAVVAMPMQPTTLKKGNWLLLDCVQDPGNVGTMIRTADAAGFAGVILGEGCADIYTTKTLRSMQGSQFHLPVIQLSLKQAIEQLRTLNVTIYGTELNEQAVQYHQLPMQENFALLMGNEGQGLAKEYLALTDQNIYIPIFGQAESLNVAIAAGILMYGLTIKK